MVLLLLLAVGGLMAVEAVDALLRMPAHLVLVDDGVLLPDVTFGALAGRADKGGGRLIGLDAWPLTVDQKCREDQ